MTCVVSVSELRQKHQSGRCLGGGQQSGTALQCVQWSTNILTNQANFFQFVGLGEKNDTVSTCSHSCALIGVIDCGEIPRRHGIRSCCAFVCSEYSIFGDGKESMLRRDTDSLLVHACAAESVAIQLESGYPSCDISA